jgi:hypothetical protein
MSLRSTRDTLESYRLLLERLEQTRDPAWDARSFAELKRILLKRITHLKAVGAAERRSSERRAA